MINNSLSYCLMILVIISSLSIISTLQLPQKVMAHIFPSEVPGVDEANVQSTIPNQLMLVLAVTIIITVVVARVQQAVAVTGRGEFSAPRPYLYIHKNLSKLSRKDKREKTRD